MDVVRWQRITVAIDGIAGEDDLVQSVGAAVEQAADAAGRSIVAIVTLTGRGSQHASLQRVGVLADLHGLVRQRFGIGEPFAWLESIRDETRPSIDLAVRREAGDLLGESLREFGRSRAALAEGQQADLDDMLADLYDHARARRVLRGVRPGAAELLAMLKSAEAMVIDQLDDAG